MAFEFTDDDAALRAEHDAQVQDIAAYQAASPVEQVLWDEYAAALAPATQPQTPADADAQGSADPQVRGA